MCFIESQDSKMRPAVSKRPTVINMDTRDDNEEDDMYQMPLNSSNTEDPGVLVSPDPTTQGLSEHKVNELMDEPNKTPNPNFPP